MNTTEEADNLVKAIDALADFGSEGGIDTQNLYFPLRALTMPVRAAYAQAGKTGQPDD